MPDSPPKFNTLPCPLSNFSSPELNYQIGKSVNRPRGRARIVFAVHQTLFHLWWGDIAESAVVVVALLIGLGKHFEHERRRDEVVACTYIEGLGFRVSGFRFRV